MNYSDETVKAVCAYMGKRIRAIRGDMTQTEFADRIGVRQATVCHWEQETHFPRLLELISIGDKMQVDIGELIEGAAEIIRKGEANSVPKPVVKRKNAAERKAEAQAKAIAEAEQGEKNNE